MSSGQEWLFHIAADILLVTEWQFHIAIVLLVVTEWQFHITTGIY